MVLPFCLSVRIAQRNGKSHCAGNVTTPKGASTNVVTTTWHTVVVVVAAAAVVTLPSVGQHSIAIR